MRMDINTDKVRLDDICLADFIDIASGEFDGLAKAMGLSASSDEVAAAARDIVFAYRSLSDPVGTKMHITELGTAAKDRAKLLLFTLAKVVAEFGEDEDLESLRHTIADDLGRQRVAKMDRDALLSFVEKELRSVQFGIERRAAKKANDVRQNGDVDVRAGFSREIAWVMSHYKMSIDTRIVSASVYANLVRRASEEVKARAKKA